MKSYVGRYKFLTMCYYSLVHYCAQNEAYFTMQIKYCHLVENSYEWVPLIH